MPEETQPAPPSINPTPEKPKRNWKKILLFLLIGLFLISLVGVGLYLLIPRLTQEPPATQPPEKQAMPPAKIKPKTTKIVWVKDREIWVKDQNSEAVKFFTEEKKILDWDLVDGTIIYITGELKDEVNYGTLIVSFDLLTKKKQTLFDSPLESILAKKENNGICNTEDPDISALTVSPDKKKIAFVQSGIWILDLKTKDIEQILKTSKINPKTNNPKLRVGECITYSNITWVSDDLFKLAAGRWESTSAYLINTAGEVQYTYANSSAYHHYYQLTFGVDPLFVYVKGPVPPENNGTEFTTATIDGGKLNIKEPFYKQNERVMEVIKGDDLLYFIDKPFNEESSVYNIKSLSLPTNKIEHLVDLGVARGKCLSNIRDNLYYSTEDLDKDSEVTNTNIYQFNLKTKQKKLVNIIDGELKGCFKITTF